MVSSRGRASGTGKVRFPPTPPILPCHERSLPGRVRPPTPLVRRAFSTTPRWERLLRTKKTFISNPPSSVGQTLRSAERIFPQLASSGFRRVGAQSLPHRAGLTRARMRVFSSIRGGEKMKRAIRLHAGRTSTPRSARSSLYRESAVPAFSVGFGFLGRDELPLSHRLARTPPRLVSSTPDSVGKLQSLLPQLQLTFPVGVDLKISIKLDKFTGFFDK